MSDVLSGQQILDARQCVKHLCFFLLLFGTTDDVKVMKSNFNSIRDWVR